MRTQQNLYREKITTMLAYLVGIHKCNSINSTGHQDQRRRSPGLLTEPNYQLVSDFEGVKRMY